MADRNLPNETSALLQRRHASTDSVPAAMCKKQQNPHPNPRFRFDENDASTLSLSMMCGCPAHRPSSQREMTAFQKHNSRLLLDLLLQLLSIERGQQVFICPFFWRHIHRMHEKRTKTLRGPGLPIKFHALSLIALWEAEGAIERAQVDGQVEFTASEYSIFDVFAKPEHSELVRVLDKFDNTEFG